jgi:hypothetical protein
MTRDFQDLLVPLLDFPLPWEQMKEDFQGPWEPIQNFRAALERRSDFLRSLELLENLHDLWELQINFSESFLGPQGKGAGLF